MRRSREQSAEGRAQRAKGKSKAVKSKKEKGKRKNKCREDAKAQRNWRISELANLANVDGQRAKGKSRKK